jgi:hypothetical protein
MALQPIPVAPAALLIGFAGYVIAVAGATLGGLDAALVRTGFSQPRQFRIIRLTGAGLAAWFLFLAMTTVSGLYLEARGPRFLLYGVPALLTVLLLSRAQWLREAMRGTPWWWIPALQTLRVGGGSSLFAAWALGLAPWSMVLPAGVGDILVGLSAAAVAAALFRHWRGARLLAVVWNVLGLLDILHTLFRAVASAPGPQRLFFDEPANTIPAVFPLVYLPGFVVPLTILLHLLSLQQLRSSHPP